MTDKKLGEVPKSTPDNWEILQSLFLEQGKDSNERLKDAPKGIDNWPTLQAMFQLPQTNSKNPLIEKPKDNPPNDTPSDHPSGEKPSGEKNSDQPTEQIKLLFEHIKNLLNGLKLNSSTQNKVPLLLAPLVLIPLLIWLAKNLLFPSSPSSNLDIYVDSTNGSDRNQGSQVDPLKTLSHALSKAKPGDTIQLAAGEYATNNGRLPSLIPAGTRILVQPSSPILFSDIKGHWAEKFVQALATKDIVRGYPDGTFQPNANLSRAEYAALLTKVFALPEVPPTKKFKDVKPDFWAYRAIQQNYAHQFLKGFPNNTFQPDQKTQRVQVIAPLVNGLGLATNNGTKQLTVYDDRGNIPGWAKEQVATATATGLVVNYPNPRRLNPTKSATRAEAAAMIYQALVETQQMPPIQSNYVVLNNVRR